MFTSIKRFLDRSSESLSKTPRRLRLEPLEARTLLSAASMVMELLGTKVPLGAVLSYGERSLMASVSEVGPQLLREEGLNPIARSPRFGAVADQAILALAPPPQIALAGIADSGMKRVDPPPIELLPGPGAIHGNSERSSVIAARTTGEPFSLSIERMPAPQGIYVDRLAAADNLAPQASLAISPAFTPRVFSGTAGPQGGLADRWEKPVQPSLSALSAIDARGGQLAVPQPRSSSGSAANSLTAAHPQSVLGDFLAAFVQGYKELGSPDDGGWVTVAASEPAAPTISIAGYGSWPGASSPCAFSPVQTSFFTTEETSCKSVFGIDGLVPAFSGTVDQDRLSLSDDRREGGLIAINLMPGSHHDRSRLEDTPFDWSHESGDSEWTDSPCKRRAEDSEDASPAGVRDRGTESIGQSTRIADSRDIPPDTDAACGSEEGGMIELAASGSADGPSGASIARPDAPSRPAIDAKDIQIDKELGLFQAFEVATSPAHTATDPDWSSGVANRADAKVPRAVPAPSEEIPTDKAAASRTGTSGASPDDRVAAATIVIVSLTSGVVKTRTEQADSKRNAAYSQPVVAATTAG